MNLMNLLRVLRGKHTTKRKVLPYIPGTIGVSAVSEAIIRDYGRFVPRRIRRKIAKISGVPLKVYYNGPVIRG